MKAGVAAVALLTAALMSQGAMAKTLEDVLKEKGVITEEDYKAVTKSKPLDYKLGKGFTFTSPDEKFQMSLGARLQSRYTFTDSDGGQNTSEFRVRRMKLFMNGYAYSKDLTYKLQVNFADSGKLLEDAWLNYRLVDEAQFLVGQEKVQFARQEITSSGSQQFVDRSNATDTFKMGRDTGLMVHGKIAKGIFNYNLGVYGGVGQNTQRKFTNNAFAARVAVNPFGDMAYSEGDLDNSQKPLLSIGAGYFMDTLAKTSATALESNNLTFAGSNGWLGKGLGKFGTEKIDTNSVASMPLSNGWASPLRVNTSSAMPTVRLQTRPSAPTVSIPRPVISSFPSTWKWQPVTPLWTLTGTRPTTFRRKPPGPFPTTSTSTT